MLERRCMRPRFAAAALFVISLTCATEARATLYDWTYGGDGHHSGSGTLTTAGASSPFTITAITGTFDGSSIVWLTDTCCGAPGSDNLLYSPPSTLLDGNGMAFVTGGEPGIYNILFLNGAYSVADVNGSLTFGGTFTATQAIGSLPGPAVPEPASWGIVAVGLGCLAAFLNRLQHRTSGVMNRPMTSDIT